MKRLLIATLILSIVMGLRLASRAEALIKPAASVEIVQYDESSFLLISRNFDKTTLRMKRIDGNRAVDVWTSQYPTNPSFKLYPLPGINSVALLFKDYALIMSDTGESIAEFSFGEECGWHYPVFSPGMAAMAFNDAYYKKILTISDKGIKVIDYTVKTNEQIVTLFAFIDDKGTVYCESESGSGYWRIGLDGSCERVKTKRRLAYACDDGVWLLNRRKLITSGGEIIKLPKISDSYSVSRSHNRGVIISDKILVSARDKRPVKIDWEFSSEEIFGFSRDLRYYLSKGDWGDQESKTWNAWSAASGMRKIVREHELKNPALGVVDPGYIVLDSGIAIFVGESDTADSWGLWALDMDAGVYSRIELS